MVFRRFRKKPARKPIRRIRRKKAIISRPLRPAVIPLVRDITSFVDSSYPALPTGWNYGTAQDYNTLQCNHDFHLDQLPDTTEFSTIFKFYKLNCVIVTITPLVNSSQLNGTLNQNPTYFGGNILSYSERNLSGQSLDTAITQDYWDQRPSKKTITLYNGKPRSFKMYPKVLSNVYLSEGNTVKAPRKSGWLPCTYTGMEIPHYGLNMQFSYIDPKIKFRKAPTIPATDDGSAPLIFRVNYRYLMQFKGIK